MNKTHYNEPERIKMGNWLSVFACYFLLLKQRAGLLLGNNCFTVAERFFHNELLPDSENVTVLFLYCNVYTGLY
jgi:hypothetical protein